METARLLASESTILVREDADFAAYA